LIEEIKPIISLVWDRSGFDLIKSYEGISGTIGGDVLLFSVETCLNSIDLCLDSWRRLLSIFPMLGSISF
jgi:hypothetical protein